MCADACFFFLVSFVSRIQWFNAIGEYCIVCTAAFNRIWCWKMIAGQKYKTTQTDRIIQSKQISSAFGLFSSSFFVYLKWSRIVFCSLIEIYVRHRSKQNQLLRHWTKPAAIDISIPNMIFPNVLMIGWNSQSVISMRNHFMVIGHIFSSIFFSLYLRNSDIFAENFSFGKEKTLPRLVSSSNGV